MTSRASPIVVSCNAAPARCKPRIALDYRRDKGARNVHIGLPRFARKLGHIPPRTLDLLEIAAYVYGADRYSSRGKTDAVEYNAWARRFAFHIRVRDCNFWSRPDSREKLSALLCFVTGDEAYDFTFYPGHKTPPSSLFDDAGFPVASEPRSVALFSGGLDSLAGAIDLLESSADEVLLVSHQPRPGTKRTQNVLVEALARAYPGRLVHYPFECSLRHQRAQEESQRTRSFLYASVAFAVAEAFGLRRFSVFENGVTSINLARRQDLLRARASRTTHPQTLHRLGDLLSHVAEAPVRIDAPYQDRTKQRVIKSLLDGPHPELISSSVSCTRTFRRLINASQCGECFQCVDRRLAGYAASADDRDHAGLYATDFVRQPFGREGKTTAVEYLRQAVFLSEVGLDEFGEEYMDEIAEVIEYLPYGGGDLEKVEKLWGLFREHGQQVVSGLQRVRELHDDLRSLPPEGSLLHLLGDRQYLRSPVSRLVASIQGVVEVAVPEMFRGKPPRNEADLNQKLAALLKSRDGELRSEHPTTPFACAQVIPDHEFVGQDLLIEAKYIRKNTPPSKATDGIAADLTKYPPEAHILFVVLDLDGRIRNDQTFRREIEAKGRNTVLVLR